MAQQTAQKVKGTGLFRWTPVARGGVVAPDQRLPWGSTVALGVQHVLAMFGATVVAPLIMGFPPNTAIFFSGVGTIIFFLIVGGKIPSYVGSSFAFITPVLAVMGGKPGANIPVALGGIIAAGAVYAIIALLTMLLGSGWINVLMPPTVTGAVVMAIGLNLAGAGAGDIHNQNDLILAGITLGAACLAAVYLPGILGRLPVLIGGVIGYLAAIAFGRINFTPVAQAAWIGLPTFHSPQFTVSAMVTLAPVAVVLIAENAGHIKAVSAICYDSNDRLDPYLGRGFLGDAVSTMVSGFFGGPGQTTYAENIGVMAMTRVYSTAAFIIAAIVAILLGLCPKFGALIQTIPTDAPGILGGLSVLLFGLIAATGGRIWVQSRVDFSNPRVLITAGVTLILGAGTYVVPISSFQLTGLTLATFAAIILYQILGLGRGGRAPVTLAERTVPPSLLS